MRTIIVLAVCVLSTLQTANGLVCNLCIGAPGSDCDKGINGSMVDENCDKIPLGEEQLTAFYKKYSDYISKETFDHPKLIMECAAYTLGADKIANERVVKACVPSLPKFGFCQIMKKHLKNLEKCTTCKEDNCN